MAARSCWPARVAGCSPPTPTASTWGATCGRGTLRTWAAMPAWSAPCIATRRAAGDLHDAVNACGCCPRGSEGSTQLPAKLGRAAASSFDHL
jgi:hypothetical protein